MPLRIFVDAYSGYKANESPRRFRLDARIDEADVKGVYEIEEVEDRWYELDAVYFRVRTTEGERHILRLNERADEWTLQSDFDRGGWGVTATERRYPVSSETSSANRLPEDTSRR